MQDISAPVNIWFVGDVHYGSADCAVGHFKETLREIGADPLARVVLMGDYCDFVNYSDRRFDVKQIAPEFIPHLDDLPRAMADKFSALLQPLAKQGKLICAIPGNHDDKIRIKYHFDVTGYICGLLGVPLLSCVSQLRLRVRDGDNLQSCHSYRLKGVVSHAEKNATTVGGKLTAMGRMADYYGSHHFFAQAHTHEYLVHEARGLDVVGAFGRPRTQERPYVLFLTGGYLKTYGPGVSGYGEKKGYRPCKLGSPRLQVRLLRTSMRDDCDRHRSIDRLEMKGI